MKKGKREKVGLIVALVVSIVGGLTLLLHYQKTNPALSPKVKTRVQAPPGVSPQILAERIGATDILFYGRVVDQYGDAVEGAEVKYYYDGRKAPSHSKSDDVVYSDERGAFSIQGVSGGRLALVSSKEGYDSVSDLGDGVGSARNFDFGFDVDGGRRYMDPASPSVLTLIKKGKLERVIHLERSHQPLIANGDGLRLLLDEAGSGHAVEFRLRVDPAAQPLGGSKVKYPWVVAISAPQGQVVEQTGIGYLAPDVGYREEVKLGYGENQLQQGWRAGISQKTIFVRFRDGTHARLEFSVFSELVNKCLTAESWFNPSVGSRQLAPGNETSIRRKGVLASDVPEK